ncbi:hypothetical protein GCM10007276_29760 [Agaricicola taiwanensis]|uniref:Uncharacterized protein n=1 Tax=Agaricicola taiwanensis TaxID=591372 RepID=A0A8J2YLG3_9RHOB|nr:hypothetical protein [Agaricicola taiwanensis]GGE50762.1 hypothetical protein GCM10007276_29760 [Agaricicola taiwanensis]
MTSGLRAIAGFLIWASALSLLYGTLSLACAWGLGPAVTLAVLLILWLAHLALGGAILIGDVRFARGQDAGFGQRLSLGANAAALGATLFTGLPIVIASPTC